jgi:hypothetical protein
MKKNRMTRSAPLCMAGALTGEWPTWNRSGAEQAYEVMLTKKKE